MRNILTPLGIIDIVISYRWFSYLVIWKHCAAEEYIIDDFGNLIFLDNNLEKQSTFSIGRMHKHNPY